MDGDMLPVGAPLVILPQIGTEPAVAPKTNSVISPADQQKIQRLLRAASQAFTAGKTDKLTQILNQILEIDPNNDQALYNLAIVCRDRKEIHESEKYFRRTIKANPDYIDAYLGFGDLLFSAKHTLSAIRIYEDGLKKAPNRLQILANLLRARVMMRHPRDVEQIARRIIAIDETSSDVQAYLAWSLLIQKRSLDEGLAAAEASIANSKSFRGLIMKERLLAALGREAEAAAIRNDLMARMPDMVPSDIKGIIEMYLWTDDVPLAAQFIQEYLLHHPDDTEAEALLIQVIMQDGDFVGSQKIVDRLAKAYPDRSQYELSSSLNWFRLGHFEEAMARMECRWGRDTAEKKWNLPAPDWKGAPIPDGKLAIYAEQGVGDHVMFAGQMVAARDKARQIVFSTSDRMVSLFQRSFPDFEVLDRSSLPPGWRETDVKAKVAAADVGYAMGLDFRNLPGLDGFLIANPALLKKLRDRYQALFPGKLLIGISWRSGNRDSAALRSLELENWLPIFKTPGLAFISLQYGDITNDIELMKESFDIDIHWDKSINPMGNLDPFTAQVAAMDLVVSVDNSTVHFAGGLGKPSWCMLPINSDWRWLEKITKPIWYNRLELLRQYKGDTWEEMIERVSARLATIDPAPLADAHNSMLKRCADTLRRYGRVPEMEDYCRLLLEAGAFKDTAFHGIGVAALAVGRAQEAVPILAKAVELMPENLEYHADLAIALDASGETGRAERLARDTARQADGIIEPLIAMGRILARHNRFDEATDYFARILRQKPDHVAARVQLAKLQAAQGEWGLASENYRKTLEFSPSAATAHIGVAESALRLGDLGSGWKHFGWRFGTRPGLLPRHLETIDPKKQPKQWDGGHLRRQRVFLRAERSLEEQLLFAPILGNAAGEARSTLAECPAELVTLLGTSDAKTSLVAAGSLSPETLIDKRIQVATSLGDLAVRYSPKPEMLGKLPVTLAVDLELAESLKEEYRDCFPNRRLVGLSWRGGEDTTQTRLEDWLGLFDADAIGLVSLQRDADETEMSEFSALGRNMVVDARCKTSLDVLAAQISALDAIVTADNLVALLAARLGKPVLKLAGPTDAWYWGSDGQASPWLPSVLVQRQKAGEVGSAYAARVTALAIGFATSLAPTLVAFR